jgi:hypothetical protein
MSDHDGVARAILATRRAPTAVNSGSNTVVGVDANLSFFQNVIGGVAVAWNGSNAVGKIPGDTVTCRQGGMACSAGPDSPGYLVPESAVVLSCKRAILFGLS